MILKYQKGFDSDLVEFNKVEPSDFTPDERKIFARYTDVTCLAAQDAQKRLEEMAYYFTLFVLSLAIFFAFLFCCGCLSLTKHRRNKRRANFFGHNNGEDNLKISHHWQEENQESSASEPQPS